jgi:hypothetical protein
LKTGSHRRADIGTLPNHCASRGIESINVIRFGYGNDHWRALRHALDVKWLGVNVADDRAAKVQIARKVRRVARRERGIDIEVVSGRIVVFLGDVDLRARRKDRVPQKNNNE